MKSQFDPPFADPFGKKRDFICTCVPSYMQTITMDDNEWFWIEVRTNVMVKSA